MHQRSRPPVKMKQVPKNLTHTHTLFLMGFNVSAFSHVHMSRYVNLWSLHLFFFCFNFSFLSILAFLPTSGLVPFCVQDNKHIKMQKPSRNEEFQKKIRFSLYFSRFFWNKIFSSKYFDAFISYSLLLLWFVVGKRYFRKWDLWCEKWKQVKID